MATITYPAIWYTSGTPITTGQRDCNYRRWFQTHAGRHGTGYRKKATAIPLATGKAVHDGVGLMGEWVVDWQRAHPGQDLGRVLGTVPDEVIAWAATEAADRYAAKARARGLELTKTDLDAAAAVELLILEQRTLIESLVWVYGLIRMPVMLAQARIVSVEYEEAPVVDCTCGLGDWVGQAAQHAARGCAGICVQDRVDLVWELFDDSTLVCEELKTKATPNYGWEQGWEHNGQLWMHMEAIGRRLGKAVSATYVPVLYKGKRDRTDRDDKASPRIQQSPLVYGWFDPGVPPMRPAEWSARYRWADEYTGKWHTLPRTFKRTPIWDSAVDLSFGPSGDNNPNGARYRDGASRVERWIKGWILPNQYPDFLKVLGPFPKPAALTLEAQRAIVVLERRWRADVAYLQSCGIYEPSDVVTVRQALGAGEGLVSTEADYETLTLTAADVIDRSWACTNFDGTPCSVRRFCHREPGWEHVLELGDFEIRTPHHATERDAMTPTIEALGLEWRDEDEEEDGE